MSAEFVSKDAVDFAPLNTALIMEPSTCVCLEGRGNKPDLADFECNRFVQVNVDFLRSPNVSPNAKLIGFVFASYADKNGRAWPGLERLKRDSGLGRDACKKARRELTSAGLLRVERVQADSGRFRRPRYVVSSKILARYRRTENQSRGKAPTTGLNYRQTVSPADGQPDAGFSVPIE